MSKIVVGYTPDKYGRAALEYAVAESRAARARRTRGQRHQGRRARRRPLRRRERDGEGGQRSWQTLGVDFEVRQFMGADIADRVVELADEVDAALIVIGIRRRSPVGKLVMGSVAQRILMDSHCPVLAVKPVPD